MALSHSISFDPADPLSSLRTLPESAAVFALYSANPSAEPYLGKAPNLRRRLLRFLRAVPPATNFDGNAGDNTPPATKRLQIAHLVHRIDYTATGSEFESTFCLYQESMRAFGDRARRRLRLRPPAFLRMSVTNRYPRVYPTTKIVASGADSLFGPFPSRAAAERYAEEMLNLFLLRRCHENLQPDPAFPGCAYSEMKMCLAPCFQGCSDERYEQEASAVLAFLESSGASLLSQVEAERDEASEALEFERAAQLHQRMQKVQAAARLAGEAVRPLSRLSGILVQPSAEPEEVVLFALERGSLAGPARYSTQGMRLPNERSGSSSLFAHPVALQPVPLDTPAGITQRKDLLELRLEAALAELNEAAKTFNLAQALPDHLALLTRWLYAPAARRVGDIIFTGADGLTPHKPLLRAIARVAARSAGADNEANDSSAPGDSAGTTESESLSVPTSSLDGPLIH